MDFIKEILSQVEQEDDGGSESFIIRICNERSGLKEPLPVYPENTLGQVLEEAYNLVGTNRVSKNICFELPGGKFVTNQEMTIEETGLKPDDVLNIIDECCVV